MASTSTATATAKTTATELSEARKLNASLKKTLASLHAQQAKVAAEAKKAAEKKEEKKGEEKKEEKKEVKSLSREEIKAAFDQFDTDKSGFIEWEEFQFLAIQLGTPLTETEVKASIATFDKDGDGKASFDEFVTWFNKPHTGTGAGEVTAALLRAKLFAHKAEAGLAVLRRTPSLELKASAAESLSSFGFGVDIGTFDRPAAAATWSVEFKHVADAAFIEKCIPDAPITFLSFDIKTVRGRNTAEGYQKYWERLLGPLESLLDLQRDFRGCKFHVSTSTPGLVRLTVTVPNPPTYRRITARRTAIAARDAERKQAEEIKTVAAAHGGKIPDDHKTLAGRSVDDAERTLSTQSELPGGSDEEFAKSIKDPFDDLAAFGIDFPKYVKKFQFRVETAFSWDVINELPADSKLTLFDFYKVRARFEATVDPVLFKLLEAAVVAVGQTMDGFGSRDREKMSRVNFIGLFKVNRLQLSFGEVGPLVSSLLSVAEAAEAARRGRGGRGGGGGAADAAAEVEPEWTEEKIKRVGLEKDPSAVAWLIKQPIKRAASLLIDVLARKARSRQYRETMAALTVAKLVSTILAQDIDELSGVHSRHKSGFGVSLVLDRYLPFPAIAALLAGVTIPNYT